MSLSSKSRPTSYGRRKSQILRVKKAPLLPRVSNHQNGWWLRGAGTTSRTGDRWAPQAWPALGHVFMPSTKLLLKKGEGQSVDGAFSNAHKYFLLLARITWGFSFTRVFIQASINNAWEVTGEACPSASVNRSVTMATIFFPFFFSLTTTVN